MKINREDVATMLYNSNWIEGIEYPSIFYQQDDLINKIPEIRNSFYAWDFIMELEPYEFGNLAMRHLHWILMQNIIQEGYAGKYRDREVTIGGNSGFHPVVIQSEMDKLLIDIKKYKTEKEIWDIHDRYEIVHPYLDGNGRSGRILLNWLRVKNGLPIKVIKWEDRFKYYEKINERRRLYEGNI